MGIRVVGVSFDPPEKNAAWKAEKGYGFELWTDQGRELALAFGAATSVDQANASRVTLLLDAEGKAVMRYAPGAGLGTHPGDVLDDAKVLFPAGK